MVVPFPGNVFIEIPGENQHLFYHTVTFPVKETQLVISGF
jgi:hypothetical protein